MKKGAVLLLVLLLSISFVSASLWTDFLDLFKPQVQLSPTGDLEIWNGDTTLAARSVDTGSVVNHNAKSGTYALEGTPTQWKGLRLQPGEGGAWLEDISGYDYLEFYAKADQEGKTFDFSLVCWGCGTPKKVNIDQYIEGGSLTTTYKKVSIPISDLAHTTSLQNLDFGTANPPGHKIYIDDIRAVVGGETTHPPEPEPEPEPIPKTNTCEDSDVNSQFPDGKNYNQEGIVTSATKKVSNDICDPNTGDLLERTCGTDGEVNTIVYRNCPNGCVDGRCADGPLVEPFCGDGFKQGLEECDDGTSGSATCTTNCKIQSAPEPDPTPEPTPDPEPTPEPEPLPPETAPTCNGCLENNICYGDGRRLEINGIDKYCDILQEGFVDQKVENEFCENNFECTSNICADNQCVDQGLFQTFLNWFASLFGGGDEAPEEKSFEELANNGPPLPEGMVADFNFDSNKDSNVYPNFAPQLEGNLEYINGKHNKAASFTGNNYLSIPDHDKLDLQEFTIAGWYFFEGDIGSGRLIAKEDANEWSYRLFTLDNGDFGLEDGLLMQLSSDGTNSDLTLSSNRALESYKNQWVHIATTYNGNNLILYINGDKKGDFGKSITIKNTNAPLGIAASGDGINRNAVGIDELEIYEIALDKAGIRELMITEDPIAEYSFEPLEFLEGSATTKSLITNDEGITGLLVNDLTVSNIGFEGDALEFDGTNEYLKLFRTGSSTTPHNLNFVNEFTLSGWFQYDSQGANNERLIAKEDANGWSYRLLSLGNGVLNQEDSLFLQVSNGLTDFSMVTNLKNQAPDYDNGKWTHIAVTYDGTKAGSKFYINGIEAPAFYTNDGQIKTILQTSAPVTIGSSGIPDHYFKGKIDKIKLYDHVVSEEDVDADIESGEPISFGSYQGVWGESICGDQPGEYIVTDGDTTRCCAFPESKLNDNGVCYQDDGRSKSKHVRVPLIYNGAAYDGTTTSAFSNGAVEIVNFDPNFQQFKDSIDEPNDFEYRAELIRSGAKSTETYRYTFGTQALTHTPDTATMNLDFPCYDDVSEVRVFDDADNQLFSVSVAGRC